MTAEIKFTIPGAPVGKGRPKFARRGKFVQAYTPEKTASYESLVKLVASQAMAGRPPLDVAASVWIEIYITPPASWSKKKRELALRGGVMPTGKPDLDNCAKSILDACNGIALTDDALACCLSVSKEYREVAETVVTINPRALFEHPFVEAA